MQNHWKFLKQEIAKHLDVGENEIEEPKEFGDFAFPCFNLSKKMRKPPQEIAKELESEIKLPNMGVKAIGPYLNFYVKWENFGNDFLKHVNEKYGFSNSLKNQEIMIEFSQPNTNKPMHIGHMRNTALGDSLCHILKICGSKVIRANYYGDIGLHVAKTILAYIKWGKNRKPNKKPDHFIGDFYTRFINMEGKDKGLEEGAREILRKWEQDDKETIKLWKTLKNWCLKGFEETYKNLNISFDVVFFESDFERIGKDIAKRLLEKKIAFKSETGEVVADLEKHGIPNCVILRSDGTSLYSTKDLALGMHKFEKYGIDKSIYVVGSEQNLYLRQVFKLLELLGYENAKNCYHLSYGLVMLPEGKMSSRRGYVVLLDDMLSILKKNVLKIMKKKNEKIAENVAVGALKYAMLKTSPENNISFNIEEVTRFDGDTGPYLQYTYARANSILKKSKVKTIKYDSRNLKEEKEILLLKLISLYPEIVEKAAKDYRPHYLANYFHNLAETFNQFYQSIPVLKSDEKVRNARLKLVESVKTILKNGLGLLGIPVVEKM